METNSNPNPSELEIDEDTRDSFIADMCLHFDHSFGMRHEELKNSLWLQMAHVFDRVIAPAIATPTPASVERELRMVPEGDLEAAAEKMARTTLAAEMDSRHPSWHDLADRIEEGRNYENDEIHASIAIAALKTVSRELLEARELLSHPPLLTGERAQIVAWLRNVVAEEDSRRSIYAPSIADAIERGDHLPSNTDARLKDGGE